MKNDLNKRLQESVNKAQFLLNEDLNNDETHELIKFLNDNPFPEDKKVHDWAEKRGKDVDKVEGHIYRIATIGANFLAGGLFNKKGKGKEFDDNELKMGIKVEAEHTLGDDDVAKLIQRRIALDHLTELPDYYTRLKKVEA